MGLQSTLQGRHCFSNVCRVYHRRPRSLERMAGRGQSSPTSPYTTAPQLARWLESSSCSWQPISAGKGPSMVLVLQESRVNLGVLPGPCAQQDDGGYRRCFRGKQQQELMETGMGAPMQDERGLSTPVCRDRGQGREGWSSMVLLSLCTALMSGRAGKLHLT